jgi:hypothetical protein
MLMNLVSKKGAKREREILCGMERGLKSSRGWKSSPCQKILMRRMLQYIVESLLLQRHGKNKLYDSMSKSILRIVIGVKNRVG